MIAGGAGLEHRLVFQGPRRGGGWLPGLQTRERFGHGLKVFPVVRPEVQPGALPCPAGDRLEKFRLEHAVLMMALFGPRIREQHPDFPKGDWGWQGVEKFQGFGPDEVAVGEPAALGLAEGPGDPLAAQVDAHADPRGKFRRVALEEVAVTAADFPNNGVRRGEHRGEFGPQGGAPLGDELDKGRFEIHGPYWREAGARCNPEAQAFGARGRRTKMVRPCPAGLSAQTRPPCSCTICFTMLKPRPVPPVSRERPFSTR